MSQPELIPIETEPLPLATRPQVIMPLATMTPMEMLSTAVSQGASLEMVSRLMDLQERYDATQAKRAFVAALSAFKSNPPELHKNKQVSFETQKGKTEYKHATLDHVSNEIGRALSVHGLSHRWNTEQNEKGRIKVTCILTHEQGHSESVSLESSGDDSGGKNSIQGVGSTVTYLERYTLLAATGMAVKDQDNDGAAIPNAELLEWIKFIELAQNLIDLQTLFTDYYAKATVSKDRDAMARIIVAKDNRKKELSKVAK